MDVLDQLRANAASAADPRDRQALQLLIYLRSLPETSAITDEQQIDKPHGRSRKRVREVAPVDSGR